ncbi:MAG: response regulator [Phycisphaerales bacterium]|nr:response regulator [Phycisphaerales bacterium]
MNQADRLKILAEKVNTFAHDLLHFDHYAIRLLNPRNNRLEMVMSAGLPTQACEIQLLALPEGNGISGLVAATGQSYLCEDTSADPRYVFGLETPGSSVTVPLKLFDRVIGIFNVESAHRGAFSQQDLQFAEIFAQYVAMSLHILNLLLAERVVTRETATGTVQGEVSGPINDLLVETQWLKEQYPHEPELLRHVARIEADAEAIRRRVRKVAQGPQTLLGVDEAIDRSEIDPALEGRRVLVADNEPEIVGTIRDVLTKRGAIVTACENGASAVKLLDQWRFTADADDGFDLVISDINLGDKTGYEVFASGKAASAVLPVILMTGFGYDPHHSIVRASQEGLQCVLFKPFQIEKLVEEVKTALANRSPQG